MEGATVGFTQADFEELRINLDKIRFGPRIMARPPIHIPGLPDRVKPKRSPKPPPEPSYDEKYQLRLW
jgi:hypothetical protein